MLLSAQQRANEWRAVLYNDDMTTPKSTETVHYYAASIAVSGLPYRFDSIDERDAWVAESPARFVVDAAQVDPAAR